MPFISRKLLILAVLLLSASLPTIALAQANPAGLNGQFAFQLNGTLTIPGIASRATAAVGSFTADGQGNITAGEMDFTSAAQTFQALPITGTYTLDDSGTGTLSLTSPKGNESFAFYATSNGSYAPVFASGSLVETDGGPVVSSGSFYQQNRLDFSSLVPFAPWQMALVGETFVTGGTPSPIYVGGSLLIESPSQRFVTTFTRRVGSGTPETIGWGGPAIDADGYGRMLFSADDYPLHMAAYIIDMQHMLVISTDAPQINPLMSGTMVRSLFPDM